MPVRPRSRRPVLDRRDRRRIGAGFLAAAAALLITAAGFVPWLAVSDPTGSVSVSGWGQLSGDTELKGTNINDLFGELGASISYRPAQFVSVVAGFALIAGLVIVARPSRAAGAVLALIGIYSAVWGLVRVFNLGEAAAVLVGDPGDAAADAATAAATGTPVAGTAIAGSGPWLTFSGGVLLTAVAVALFVGWLDTTLMRVERNRPV